MVRYAAENGYDGISWTPGEQQADRYDLNRQVKEVWALKNLNDTYAVGATGTDGQRIGLGGAVPTDKLEDLVGKSLAQKIIAGEGEQKFPGGARSFSGVDLKVGGEGMKGFYDKILPSVADNIGKPFGAKVADTTISVEEPVETDAEGRTSGLRG